MTANRRDLAAGAIFALIGTVFLVGGLDLDPGTLRRMGPGAYPRAVSILLIGLGGLIIAQGLRRDDAAIGPVPWRGLVLLLAAPVVFGLLLRGAGLVPALVVATGLAAFASRRMRALPAVLLVAGLTLFCLLVFVVGLGIPVRPFGAWFG